MAKETGGKRFGAASEQEQEDDVFALTTPASLLGLVSMAVEVDVDVSVVTEVMPGSVVKAEEDVPVAVAGVSASGVMPTAVLVLVASVPVLVVVLVAVEVLLVAMDVFVAVASPASTAGLPVTLNRRYGVDPEDIELVQMILCSWPGSKGPV
jgi:hypothetical protein